MSQTTGVELELVNDVIRTLALDSDQQRQIIALAAKYRGNLRDPSLRADLESMLTPEQRQRASKMLVRFGITVKPALDDAKPSGGSPYRLSFAAGQRDPTGNVLGGTEIVSLVPFEGTLFAACGFCKDVLNRRPRRGAQVLILDSASGVWRLDEQLDVGFQSIVGMEAHVFGRQQARSAEAGVPLLFLAPLGGRRDNTPIFVRGPGGVWNKASLPDPRVAKQPFCFGFHRDRETDTEHVLVACHPGGIYAGELAPKTHRVIWKPQPELDGLPAEPGGFAECDDTLFLAAGTALYHRVDGGPARWVRTALDPTPRGCRNAALHGLVAVPSPDRAGQVLLAGLNGAHAKMIRIDPRNNFRVTIELDVSAFLKERWGNRPRFVLLARERIVPVADSDLAPASYLIGLEARLGRTDVPTVNGWEPGAWYLIRGPDQRYALRRITCDSPSFQQPLIGTRAIAVSTVADETGGTIYFGGYNPDAFPAHRTAWIFQAVAGAVTQPDLDNARADGDEP